MLKFEEFLEVDHQNLEESKRVFREFDKDFFIFIDELGNLIQLIANEFGKNCKSDDYNIEIKLWAKNNSMPKTEAFKFLKDAKLINIKRSGVDDTQKAKMTLERVYSYNSRAHLLLRLQRDYFMGLSELLKLRYITAFSYYRLQTESFSLIKLFSDHPHIAQQWTLATSQEAGQIFHDKHHEKVVRNIKNFNLNNYYDLSSSFSMHSRIMGIASGMALGKKTKEERNERSAVLVYNEIENFQRLSELTFHFLKFHNEMIKMLPGIIPEIDNNFIENDIIKISTKLNLFINKSYNQKIGRV